MYNVCCVLDDVQNLSLKLRQWYVDIIFFKINNKYLLQYIVQIYSSPKILISPS